MQSLPITRTTYPISRTLVLTLLLAAITAMVTIPGVAHAQINPQLNISVSQDQQNWPLKSGTGVRAGLPTDVVYYVTDTMANNEFGARYWNSGYVPSSWKDTNGGMQELSIGNTPTTLLGRTTAYPTGAVPASVFVPQVNEANSYLYFVRGAPMGGPPELTIPGPMIVSSFQQLNEVNTLKGWSF